MQSHILSIVTVVILATAASESIRLNFVKGVNTNEFTDYYFSMWWDTSYSGNTITNLSQAFISMMKLVLQKCLKKPTIYTLQCFYHLNL